MNHTPEPWTTEAIFQEDLLDICIDYEIPGAGSPIPIAHVCGKDEHGYCPRTTREANANANRIVSCVNALAGVNNPQKFRMAFDDMLGSIRESVKEFEILEKERPDATWIGRILDNNRMILKQAQEALGVTSPAD